MIYLDYSATTPVDDRVLDTFVKVTKDYIGNPNSLHELGVEAKKLIDASTKQIADILKVKENEVIYTSGASEANNMAIKGICFKYKNRGKHIITTTLEHSSVLEVFKYLENEGFEVSYAKLDKNGVVDIDELKKIIRDDTILVSICSVNSEVGVRQPVEEIGLMLKDYPKLYFHSDVTQSIGKEKVDFTNIDLASFSGQKFYGMKGIGGLIKKESIILESLIHGGKSTTVFRSGTPATALIVSLAKAMRLAYENYVEKRDKVEKLNKYLVDSLKELPVDINSNNKCIPHIVNLSLRNIKSETMLHALERDDIYISTQTACSQGNYSLAVFSVTNDKEKASRSIRISLSHLTTKDEIDKFLEVFKINLDKLNILDK